MTFQACDAFESTTLQGPAGLPMLTGRRIVPARDCTYLPHINPNDLLDVDFDCRSIGEQINFGEGIGNLHCGGEGFYLIEILNDQGVEWRGCRLFETRPDGLNMDFSGSGDWRLISSLESYRMRVAGYVHQVYKPSL